MFHRLEGHPVSDWAAQLSPLSNHSGISSPDANTGTNQNCNCNQTAH